MFSKNANSWPSVVNEHHVEALSYWEKDLHAPNSRPSYKVRFFNLNLGINRICNNKLSTIDRYGASVSAVQDDGKLIYNAEVYTMKVNPERNEPLTKHKEVTIILNQTTLEEIAMSIFRSIAIDLNLNSSDMDEGSINL